jgi:hypothetical protein
LRPALEVADIFRRHGAAYCDEQAGRLSHGQRRVGGGNARARSQVTIDDLDLLPAQSTHPFGHRILQLLTFLILSYLSFAGLPKVDDRLPSQMLRFDLGTVQNFGH